MFSLSSLALAVIVVVVCTVLMAVQVAVGQPPASPGDPVLPPDPLASAKVMGKRAELGSIEAVPSPAGLPAGVGPAVRLASRNGAPNEWDVQAVIPIARDVKAGDVVLVRFWLRCTESMTGEGSAGLVFEQGSGQHLKAVEQRLGAGREWAEVFVPFKATRDYTVGDARLAIRMGYDRQTIEVAGLSVVNYGPTADLAKMPRTRITYAGREPTAPWRAAADERIEQHRKGDLAVAVVDASGKPVAGATAAVELTRHAFAFGSCVDANHLMADTPDGQKYREIVERHFTSAVFENDMKWPALWSGVPPVLDKSVAWLRERNIRVRGHNLVWPSWRWMPREMAAYQGKPDELRRLADAHIRRTVERFKDDVYQWDVVNEPYSEHDLIDALGGRQVMVDWFKAAREADPDCVLFLNDFGIFDSGRGMNEHEEHFYETIRFLKESGAPIGGVGIQSHFTSDLPGPDEIYETLERFAAFGLPIESTEVSFNLDDRPLQADYLRDYLTIAFSHPRVEGIMLWGFWSKRHWRPEGALWDDDWNLRPHGQAYLDLVHGKWRTKERRPTDDAGVARVRGFLGRYQVTVTTPDGRSATATAELPREGSRVTVTLR